jgi:hypothetical protein
MVRVAMLELLLQGDDELAREVPESFRVEAVGYSREALAKLKPPCAG